MNSSNVLARNARKYPQAEAIVSMGKRTTYSELNKLVNQLADALIEKGVFPGDKVILFMPNVLEFVISYFAVQRIGAIVVPINAKFTLKEVKFVMNHADAKAIIIHERLFANVANLTVGDIKIKTGEAIHDWDSFEHLISNGDSTEIECFLKEDHLSTIFYTSSTTGNPKGVLFTYRHILTVAHLMAAEMDIKPESRLLLMMPLSHSTPLHLFLMVAFVVGGTSVLTPTFTPNSLIDTVVNEKTTHFFGPHIAYLLTASHPRIAQVDLSSMQWWLYGGASHIEWGETVKSVFASSEKVDIEAFKTFLSSQLTRFKIPTLYEQVAALPHNATEKISIYQKTQQQ
ncbi:AMP-binding protein [Lysinibacillus sp. KU-BSD001]|uniref:class I adenylate-forming enzyme family protein n=1 Tax=Lysinibacillus sp. KU-BSD001 TaxID=3141328 RepID=UPI0036F0BA50